MNKKWLFGLIPAAVITLGTVWIAWENTALSSREIVVSDGRLPKSFSGFRIALVSDLHDAEFGAGNKKLLALLQEGSPDLIAITGDLVDSSRSDIDAVVNFAAAASEIAPTAYVTGNHEVRLPENSLQRLLKGLEKVGVQVLRGESFEISRNGEKIRIAGADDLGFFARDCSVAEAKMRFAETIDFSSGAYTVLLSHRPDLPEIYDSSGAAVTLCGHVHGGQFRIPLLGGVYAPGQGIFPEYDSGLYRLENSFMIVSRGLGNSAFPFRINNRPEVIFVKLEQQEEK